MRHCTFPHFQRPQLLLCLMTWQKLLNLVMFVLWSSIGDHLLQAIPWQPCHILAWLCSLSNTTNWALGLYAIYLFFGWYLWKLGWPQPIMCVQAISQELTVRKISWGVGNVKGNVYSGPLFKKWALVASNWWQCQVCNFPKWQSHFKAAFSHHKGS